MQQYRSWWLSILCACPAAGCGGEDPNYDYVQYYDVAVGGSTTGPVGTTDASTTAASSSVTTGAGPNESQVTSSTSSAANVGTSGGFTSASAGTGAGGNAGSSTASTDAESGISSTGAMSTGNPGATSTGAGGTMSTPMGMTSGGTTGLMVPEAAYCESTVDWDEEWQQLEQQILEIVNEVCASGAVCGNEAMPPVGPLEMNAELQCAARMHSLDMDERDFFAHDNPDNDGPSERMDAAGYSGRGWGENIAAGRDTAEGTMDQWMNSPGHCRNIMSEGYSLIGVGYHPGGQYGHLWTQTFGG